MPHQNHPFSQKLNLISWLVLPILVLWITTNYLIGINKKTEWENVAPIASNVSQEQARAAPLFEWRQTGLVTLWFDDAWYSQYSIGFPILEEKGLKGAIAVATDLVDGESYMTWPQIRRLQYNGWEITSHSLSHTCDLDKLAEDEIINELRDSQNVLRQQGFPADQFVTPCGAQNDIMSSHVRSYYVSLRNTEEGLNPLPVSNPYSLKINVIRNTTTVAEVKEWLQQAQDSRSWLIIVFHQIGVSNQSYEIAPALFNSMIKEISLSGLPVILPSQGLQLVIKHHNE